MEKPESKHIFRVGVSDLESLLLSRLLEGPCFDKIEAFSLPKIISSRGLLPQAHIKEAAQISQI